MEIERGFKGFLPKMMKINAVLVPPGTRRHGRVGADLFLSRQRSLAFPPARGLRSVCSLASPSGTHGLPAPLGSCSRKDEDGTLGRTVRGQGCAGRRAGSPALPLWPRVGAQGLGNRLRLGRRRRPRRAPGVCGVRGNSPLGTRRPHPLRRPSLGRTARNDKARRKGGRGTVVSGVAVIYFPQSLLCEPGVDGAVL